MILHDPSLVAKQQRSRKILTFSSSQGEENEK